MDFIQIDQNPAGAQRLHARFMGHAYDLHRHETYAVGLTLSGVQAFDYRGEARASVAGDCMVLHPDELHNGHAGAGEGFRYLMVYVEPWLLRSALPDGTDLPFVPRATGADPVLAALIQEVYAGFPDPPDPLQMNDFLAGLGERLAVRSDSGRRASGSPAPTAQVARARALLTEEFERSLTSADLEAATGLNRFELARAFRHATGTSPHRYLIGKRLDAARSMIGQGEAIADAAHAVGFADQSHLTRHFKTRYGVTPSQYRALTAAAPG